MQSHALSFFHLSAPDLLLGMDSDPAKRNVAGLLEEHPDALRDGIALRKFGQQVIERLAKERVHPSWTVPGGVNAPLDPHAREKTLAELPAAIAIVKRTLALWKATVDSFPDEIDSFSQLPDHVLRPGRAGRLAAALRRQPALRRRRRRASSPTRCGPTTTRPTSARRRSPTPT